MTATIRLFATGTARAGDLTVHLDLEVRSGEVVALVGPNGAGKSSTLHALLGWLPVEGEVTVDGRAVTASPPHRRGLGWCPQSAGLPPRARIDTMLRRAAGEEGRDALTTLRSTLSLDGLPTRAGALSGGQAQRVALARALLTSELVLLDEPLAAQDAAGSAATVAAIRAHVAAGGAALVVAHRPDDVDQLADRVVVLEAGQVVQRGTLDEVRAAPRTPHVARVLGTTVLSGVVDGQHVLRGAWGSLRVADGAGPGPATALIRPATVALSVDAPSSGSQRNVIEVTVRSLGAHPDGVTVSLSGAPDLRALVTADAVAALGLAPGQRLWASVKAADVRLSR